MKKIILILTIFCPLTLLAINPAVPNWLKSEELAVKSWKNPLTRWFVWSSVEDADIHLICFDSEELENEPDTCVCRGPKMYGTPSGASDEFYKFISFQVKKDATDTSIEEDAKEHCKPSDITFR